MKLRNFFKTVLILPFAGAAVVPMLASLGNRKILVETPLDRVCVRRLMVEINKQMSNISSQYIFDTADKTTTKKMLYHFDDYLRSLTRRGALHQYTISDIKTENNLISFELHLKTVNSGETIVLSSTLEKS